nr:MAG TPA: hypothetical protein [Caudoviricetes sp.]
MLIKKCNCMSLDFTHCIIPFCDIIFSKTEELTCF